MAVKDSKWSQKQQHFSFQGPPNLTKYEILGMKTNHLATLPPFSFNVWLFTLGSCFFKC
jgi:hypothetical protein